MRKNILTALIAILLPLIVCPQTYKYIGMEDGLCMPSKKTGKATCGS